MNFFHPHFININKPRPRPLLSCATNPSTISPDYAYLISSVAFTLVQLVSQTLSERCYKLILKKQLHSSLTSSKIPKISISDYLYRICRYTKIEEDTLILALIYIDRFCKKQNVLLTDFNVHRILFASIVIAIKYIEDKFYSNKYYCKIGGMDLDILNEMEMKFLIGIGFDLYVEEKFFHIYKSRLMKL